MFNVAVNRSSKPLNLSGHWQIALSIINRIANANSKKRLKNSRALNKQPRRRHRVKCKLFGDRMTSAWIYWEANGHRMWVSIDLFFELNHSTSSSAASSNLNPIPDPILWDWPRRRRNMKFIEWMTFRFYFPPHACFIIHDVCNSTLCRWNLASHCVS